MCYQSFFIVFDTAKNVSRHIRNVHSSPLKDLSNLPTKAERKKAARKEEKKYLNRRKKELKALSYFE